MDFLILWHQTDKRLNSKISTLNCARKDKVVNGVKHCQNAFSINLSTAFSINDHCILFDCFYKQGMGGTIL